MENNNNSKEYEADWGDTPRESKFTKTLIPADSYNAGKIATTITLSPDLNDKTKKIEKISILCKVQTTDKEVELTHWLQPKITKGSTGKNGVIYSNSKLYDLLCDLNLKDDFKQKVGQKFTAQQIADYLDQALTGKMLRVNVKTSKANTPEAYSSISKILRFV